MSRTHQRKGFTNDTRMALLEGDADSLEGDIAGINDKLDTLIKVAIKAGVGLATSAVLIVTDVVLRYVVKL